MIETREATIEDAYDLGPRLRQSDKDEIAALSGGEPTASLFIAIARSTEAHAVLIDGRVEALYGFYKPDGLGRSAAVWAMGSDRLPDSRKSLIRVMRGFLDEVETMHGGLTNVVDAANRPAIRLLERLGFQLGRALAMPGGGRGMIFWRRPSSV